jgi:hypothetical protein
MNKKILILFSAAALITIGLVLLLSQPPETEADSSDNVFGFAWAWAPRTMPLEESGLGWISFNSTNCDSNPEDGLSDGIPAGCPLAGTPMSSYGVNIESDGNLAGYAYYDMDDPNTPEREVGWIDFDYSGPYPSCPASTCPDGSPNYSARVDLTGAWDGDETKKPVTGWAKALGNGGGWDGWILFGPINKTGVNYGTHINTATGEFYGWAWGENVMGWISLNCDNPEGGSVCSASDYKVETNFSFPSVGPTASDLNVDPNSTSYCGFTIKEGHIGVGWLYNGDDPQEEYQIQVATNSSFGAPIIDKFISQTIDPGSRGTSGFDVLPSPGSGELEVGYNDTYWCRVKVKDNQGVWSSGWSNSITFSTPQHAYPWPDFDWTPKKVVIDEPVEMINNSKCFDINNNETPCSSWHWTIPADAIFVATSTAADFEPHIQFSSIGNNSVTLRAYDSSLGADGYCDITKLVEVRLTLLDWEEISPY